MEVFCARQCNQSGQNRKGKCRRQSLNRNTESLLGELLVGAKENVPWSPGANGFALFLPPQTPRTLLVPQLLPGQRLKREEHRWNVNFNSRIFKILILLMLEMWIFILDVGSQREWSGPSLPDGTACGSHGPNWEPCCQARGEFGMHLENKNKKPSWITIKNPTVAFQN